MATWQLESRDDLWSDASLGVETTQSGFASFHRPLVSRVFTPPISEVVLVDPDMAAAPSLDLWQVSLTTTGVRMVHI